MMLNFLIVEAAIAEPYHRESVNRFFGIMDML